MILKALLIYRVLSPSPQLKTQSRSVLNSRLLPCPAVAPCEGGFKPVSRPTRHRLLTTPPKFALNTKDSLLLSTADTAALEVPSDVLDSAPPFPHYRNPIAATAPPLYAVVISTLVVTGRLNSGSLRLLRELTLPHPLLPLAFASHLLRSHSLWPVSNPSCVHARGLTTIR